MLSNFETQYQERYYFPRSETSRVRPRNVLSDFTKLAQQHIFTKRSINRFRMPFRQSIAIVQQSLYKHSTIKMELPKRRSCSHAQKNGDSNNGSSHQTLRRKRIRKPRVRITYGRILTLSLSVFGSLSLILLYLDSVPSSSTTRQLRMNAPPVSIVASPKTSTTKQPTSPKAPQLQPVPPTKPLSKLKKSILPLSITNGTAVQEQLNFIRAHRPALPYKERPISTAFDMTSSVPVPIVIMAYNRLDYLQQSLTSLIRSDFPRQTVPVIVSVDGHIVDVLQYLETLQAEFPLLQVWIHPYACTDHPNDFPMKVTTPDLGDSYGNPRTPEITCCKHHFTWLLQETFTSERLNEYDTFLFLEEDYIVAPTVYETIQQGMNAMVEYSVETQFLGVALDPTNGGIAEEPVVLPDHLFYAHAFQTGPMTMHRDIYQMIVRAATDYCTMDESNWDWTLVHLTLQESLPHIMLFPSRSQVRHIGLDNGMHEHIMMDTTRAPLSVFHATAVYGPVRVNHTVRPKQVSGGWGHKMDHEHCLRILSLPRSNNKVSVLIK